MACAVSPLNVSPPVERIRIRSKSLVSKRISIPALVPILNKSALSYLKIAVRETPLLFLPVINKADSPGVAVLVALIVTPAVEDCTSKSEGRTRSPHTYFAVGRDAGKFCF